MRELFRFLMIYAINFLILRALIKITLKTLKK